tara:strand:- start:770 stop:1978 length:1209 start_codon:yes stop_codon:yes gene_type:complete
MNISHSEYVLKQLKKYKFIKEWINGKYKEKPLIIYGKSGIGKTSLAEYILKDFTKVIINVESCKNISSLKDHLDMSLYKKSITMMFTKKNVYKCILFDDLNYLQLNDKILFKSILDFSKEKNINHPVIFIFNSIKHKNIQILYKKCFPICISYTEKQFIDISNRFFLNNETIDVKILAKKSQYNFNSLKINLDFKANVENVESYEESNHELEEYIKKMFQKDTEMIIKSSYSDYNIIGLNILENCPRWIFSSKLDYKKKINLLSEIYENNYLSDTILTKIHSYSDWGLTKHIIVNTIVIPVKLLQNNIKIDKIDYNKYISKCIIYTHNRKLLDSIKIDYHNLAYLYDIMNRYYTSNFNEKKLYFMKVKDYIHRHDISLKILEKFSKYYLSQKNDYKTLYKLI